ncbi:Fur family transcriptional regulator [Ralstonia insidiosa]|uniref:Transcriptional repressor n=1 Tax=Ralstonia insidiosa TaxID=190721 RepID=A0A848NZL0_9RALS|nr:Fur family transcriptional regulator [Ralstonia insidiosa]NMV40851.1 transcriptional repressor [Ralstonia insidiosa]
MNTPAPRDDLSTSQPDSPDAAARTRLRSLGSRVTEPRVRVLAVLMQDAEPLSHQAVCDALPEDAGIDRVTVYRVLDWLVAGGIVHKTAGADRVFRFSLAEHDAAREAAHRSHSHFHCTQCGRDFCLETAEPPAMPKAALPAGFAADHAELTIKGCCADCAHPAAHHQTGNASCPK